MNTYQVGGSSTPYGVRETLRKDTADNRRAGPGIFASARDTFSSIASQFQTRSWPTQPTVVLPSVAVNYPVYSTTSYAPSNPRWIGRALAIAGAALMCLGLLTIAPEIALVGLGSLIVGGLILR